MGHIINSKKNVKMQEKINKFFQLFTIFKT